MRHAWSLRLLRALPWPREASSRTSWSRSASFVLSRRLSIFLRSERRRYLLEPGYERARRGRVAEHGSHEALMRKGGLYAEMFESQSAWYKEEVSA